jgi:Family of unknown function (DUF5995)
MASDIPPGGPPVTSVAEAITRMQHIEAALPAGDGIACFNRMYLEVTQQVDDRISQGFFADPAFMSFFDVTFANVYFAAVDMLANEPTNVPAAWQPLFDARSETDIYPIQFALAGMNAHINHDLPIALVDTCTEMKTAPDDATHHADYQRVDVLLDAAEQSIRRSFESSVVLDVDRHAQSVLDLIGNWSINSARDVAWDTALALWQCRSVTAVEDLLMNSVARTVAMASRCLLISGAAEDRRVQSAGTPLLSLFGFELRWRG